MRRLGIDLSYFFTYEDEIPDGVGFSHFGPVHLLWLGVCAGLLLLFLHYYKRWGGRRRLLAERGIGIFLVGLEVYRIAVLALIGKMSLYQLPLHLCSMAGFLCCLHAFFKWDWLGQVLYTLCLPGTVLALLFPDWVRYPAIHFITIQGFTFHAGIVLYVICQLLQHNIIPRLAALWKVIVFLLVVVPPVYLFDKKFHANYMFVNVPSPGSPLDWLASFLGNPGLSGRLCGSDAFMHGAHGCRLPAVA